ncbi:hypothetical protein [Microscilla marina]|uniref:Uncharacterized protein n=1 Tax=Microscilla marina ATCC 23134 TaxID=313606 RepID=A1ZZC7_MICM2|nr:hypothetical protein [Microscilla marina]EAY24279.1 hypothetical protein M23134_03665 [Microscilla marina ATCC 23134]
MQSTDLNQEVQNIAIPQSIIDLFAQSLQARLEAFVFNGDILLECAQIEDYHQLANHLQASIFSLQAMLNEYELLGKLRQAQG